MGKRSSSKEAIFQLLMLAHLYGIAANRLTDPVNAVKFAAISIAYPS
jgi:hypothetical protein